MTNHIVEASRGSPVSEQSIKATANTPDHLEVKQGEPTGDRYGRRMTVQFTRDQAKHLDWLADTQELTQAEVIRKALATESYLQQHIQRGCKVFIKDGDSLCEVVFR